MAIIMRQAFGGKSNSNAGLEPPRSADEAKSQFANLFKKS